MNQDESTRAPDEAAQREGAAPAPGGAADAGDANAAQAQARRGKKMKKPPVLFRDTQKLIDRLEAHLGGPLLVYWNSFSGSVCDSDVIGMHELLRQVRTQDSVHLFIKSDGGNGMSSLRIVNLIRQYVKRVTALVPLDCLSAATMIALGAEEIRMGPIARLSAVDTSIRHELSPLDRDNSRVSVSQNEVARIVEAWKSLQGDGGTHPLSVLFQHVHPLVIGAVDRASSLSIRLCREILGYHLSDAEAARRISECLNADYPSHSYPITLREAQRIGLNAQPMDAETNDLLLELNGLYSDMGQRAITDYDESNHHDNQIANILERRGLQVYFQFDKDWHYRAEERRWVSLNDESSWRRVERVGGKVKESRLHIS